jgi:trimeric autotransporter adhesin
MAQIIKHRRGSLEKLSEVTGSLQKGEIVIATGSANLTTTNGSALAFIVPESGSVQASNRFLMGSSDPAIFSASTYNGMLKGVPYYASGSKTLFLLGSGGNEAINLVGNIQPFSGSVNTRLGDLEASIGGGGSGIGTRVSSLEAKTGSYATTGSNQFNGDQTITGSLLVTGPIKGTGSIFLQPDAADGRQLEIYNTAATDVHIKGTTGLTFLGDDTNYVLVDNSVGTISITGVSGINFTGSLSASGNISASTISGIGNVTSFSQSVDTRFSASAAAQTSLSASVASVTGDFSSSVATSFSASAAAVAALSTSVDSRLDSLEFNDTRLATTGSNTFIGTQVVTGSMYITQDLIVQGSSSLQNITASAVSIGTNTVILNTATPAVRFGGISVADSGSGQGASGSLFWDSLNNRWIYEHPEAAGEGYNSAILIAGPKNTGSLGDEATLTPGYIQFATGEDHIGNSIMSQSNGDKITLTGGLDVTGNISSSTITGIGNVTLYSQSVDSRLGTIETSLGGGGSLGTRVANLETISSSYLAFTQSYYTDSASFDTRISASVAGYTANSASAATSFSASLASQTALSASISTTNNTQTDNITTATQAAAGAFASASAYSGSAATSFSASLASQTALSASIATTNNTQTDNITTATQAAAGAFASASAYSGSAATSFSASLATITANSASAATDFNTLSGSAYTQFSASAFTATANSASAGTSISASNAQIAALSASVASTTGDFSGSIYTQFSASAFTATANSASAASDFNTLSGSTYTQFSASAATVTANSASAATSFSASLASQTALSASIATTNNGQTDRIVKLEASQSDFDTAIGLSGTAVTIKGNLTVQGTTTQVDSTIVNINDNILTLNAAGTSDGGIIVRDSFGGGTNSGSLLWDVTNDYWKVGAMGVESKILTAGGMSVVSGSAQIDITSTTGYSTFSSSIATTDSASLATITANSASAATSFSASLATITANSASSATSFSASLATITANSASVATSLSASLASQTALSTSVDSRLDTLEGTGTIQGVGTTNNVTFNSVTASLNVPSGGGASKRVAFRNTNDSIDFVAAPTTSGDLLQWNGTDFVMSNVIDGGAF